jgi:hypothetical protein
VIEPAKIPKPTSSQTTTMGKLNIAHHKSYHPYRRDNIERVRKDEEEAAAKEAREEGRVLLADSEARIDLLRGKAGLGAGGKGKGKEKEKESVESITGGVGLLTGSGGHINFFEDLEQVRSFIASLAVTLLTNNSSLQFPDPQSPKSRTQLKRRRAYPSLHRLKI